MNTNEDKDSPRAVRMARLRGLVAFLREMFPDLTEEELVEKLPMMLTTSKEIDKKRLIAP